MVEPGYELRRSHFKLLVLSLYQTCLPGSITCAQGVSCCTNYFLTLSLRSLALTALHQTTITIKYLPRSGLSRDMSQISPLTVCKVLPEHSYTHFFFPYCLWLFTYRNGRVKELQQRLCGLQHVKYLLGGS